MKKTTYKEFQKKLGMRDTYTVYKVELSGKLSNKEHMNSADEVEEWLDKVYGKFATVKVVQDRTKHWVMYTDAGTRWERVDSGKGN